MTAMSADNQRPTIAFLVPHIGTGGAEVVLGNILSHMPSDRLRSVLVAPNGQPLNDLAREHGLEVYGHRFPVFPSTSFEIGERRFFNPFATLYGLWLTFGLALQIARWLRQEQVQILYTSETYAHLIGAVACTVNPACKLVWHVHEIMSPRLARGLGPLFFGFVARYRVARVVVPSQAIAETVRSMTDVRVVPNGIDLKPYTTFGESTLRTELNVAADVPLIGMVGRITAWKGQRLFIEAANQLIQEGLPGLFVIVGDAVFDKRDYKAELLSLVKKLGIQERIIFTGFRKDIPNIMHGLDIVVVPSIMPEPFGLVAVEAMASRKPVVGSNAGGLADIIVEGKTGLRFVMGDAAALAAALRQLIDQPDLRVQYGEAGLKRAAAFYSVEQFATNLYRILDDIIGSSEAHGYAQ